MSQGLRLTARALECDDHDVAEQAMSQLRTLRDRLSELGRTRTASSRAARRSAVWRSQIAPVVREAEDAGRLDLLGGSCLTLTRTAMSADRSWRGRLAPHVHELADALAGLAIGLGDRSTRQDAADRALEVARRRSEGASGRGRGAGGDWCVPRPDAAVLPASAVRTAASDALNRRASSCA